MKKLFKHKLALFLIIATIAAAALIGFFSVQRNRATALENGVQGAVTPVQKPVNAVASWFYNLTHYFGDVDALKTENESLRDENAQLEKQLRDLDRLEEENRRLVEMLDLKDTHTEFTLTAARVIAKDPSNWYSTFTIDKGTADGLQIKQPVITAQENLVGQITRIGSNWAEVTTVLDPANAVGSAVQRSRDIGIVEGDGTLRYSGQCKMAYLSRDTDIEEGDYIETSGLGGVYPKGILIGQVEEIGEDSATMSKYATIQPFADFGKITEVFVITNPIEQVGDEEE